MKYKSGQRVRIKSLDWYNDNKDDDEIVVCQDTYFDEGRTKFCDKIVTIKSLHGSPNCELFRIVEDNGYYWWSTDMIEGLVDIEPIEAEIKEVIHCPDGYQFKDEYGNLINTTKIVLEKKKKEYPKTYRECCTILGCESIFGFSGLLDNEENRYARFIHLIRCRDAYWKIAGEEMGLGKSWKPDWEGEGWYVIVNHRGDIVTDVQWHANAILAFPTEEMRDEFYENFKVLIEHCKELL